jgi:hypothetical protein
MAASRLALACHWKLGWRICQVVLTARMACCNGSLLEAWLELKVACSTLLQ